MICEICGNKKALMAFADGTCSKCHGSITRKPGAKLCKVTYNKTGKVVVFASIAAAAHALKFHTKTVENWCKGLPSKSNLYKAQIVGSL